MASERFYSAAQQLFVQNGTTQGSIIVASSLGFKVKSCVLVSSSTQGILTLEIKAIPSRTEIQVGPPGADMLTRADLSAYLVSDTASILMPRQKRPSIGPGEMDRATYEEEPTVARRVIAVDEHGDFYDVDNPLPVQLSDGSINIETLNAELRVQLSAKDNDPKAGDVHSSVRVGDGTNELHVNPDGSINVVVDTTGGSIVSNVFSQVTSVASGVQTTVLTYTTPSVGRVALVRAEFGGTNISTFELYIDSVIQSRRRVGYGNDFCDIFEFASGGGGLPLTAGQVVTVKVQHDRPDLGDFESRLLLTTS